jgi:cytochrome c oxidase subunit 4
MSDHVLPVKIYLLVFAVLLVLTGTTVAVAFMDLGPLNTAAALTIAVVKALVVVLYFMHVRYSSQLTWIFVSAGFFWFLILVAFLFGDVFSRGWLQTPTGWGG